MIRKGLIALAAVLGMVALSAGDCNTGGDNGCNSVAAPNCPDRLILTCTDTGRWECRRPA